jgi:hypothetical protein
MCFGQHPSHNWEDIQEVNTEQIPIEKKEVVDWMEVKMTRVQAIHGEQADKYHHKG